jgi:hypothetical protein
MVAGAEKGCRVMKYAGLTTIERKLEPILSAGHNYDFAQTPVDFFAATPERRTTTNCKDVGHQALRQLRGIYLPPETQIVEAFFSPDAPAPLFSRVHPTEQLRIGDWIMLGRPAATSPRRFEPSYDASGNLTNWDDFDVNHLAVYLGEFGSDSLVLHATPEADGAVISTLAQARGNRRTSVMHDVLRANPTELAA